MPNEANCTISANADITGIGIRASIYGQVLLTLFTLVFVCADCKVNKRERALLKELRRTLVWTYCTFILNGFISLGLNTLDPFHAVILLYLSWINFIVIQPLGLVLTAHSNSKSKSDAPTFIVWGFFLIAQPVLGLAISVMIAPPGVIQPRIVGFEGDCVHLVIMNPFGAPSSIEHMMNDSIYLVVYAFLLLFGLFLCLLAIILWLIGKKQRTALGAWISQPFTFFQNRGKKFWWSLLLLVTILLTVPMVFLAILTERMLVRNQAFLQAEEREWSFGQTLAIIMLGAPVWTTLEQVWRSWREDRISRLTEELPPVSHPSISKNEGSQSIENISTTHRFD